MMTNDELTDRRRDEMMMVATATAAVTDGDGAHHLRLVCVMGKWREGMTHCPKYRRQTDD